MRYVGALKGWRTILFNALVVLVALGYATEGEKAAILAGVAAAANIGLRLITNTPVGKKE